MSEKYPSEILERLFAVINSRKGANPSTSYTARLFDQGVAEICAKIDEEAGETVTAALSEGPGRVVAESADLLYHLMVLWAEQGVEPGDIWAELARREGTSGIDEKKSRKP